ncbi:peptide methionine sulfoxide reductase MsrA isoform X2 [Oreochromis niloticus]|uniref:peptide methionine sulfoxide reductase MsrA isoform X2 n=1 Tax=Oreochromis niloticus TaxID=8128 RepID=UPI000DF13857|nr:peptide methionine sulfoxide reductase MsrA isoform X2 [Oreochromis niloticus]
MEACRKTRATSQLRPQTQTQIVWLLVVYVCFAVAETMSDKTQMPSREAALKGREEKMVVADKHAVNGNPTVEPFPEGMETIMFGMGCFWGAEKLFWRLPGVFSTQVGYASGFTPNPTYEEVCSGLTGHTEVVRVVFSPQDISLEELLKHFWENHDPTQVSPSPPVSSYHPLPLPTPPISPAPPTPVPFAVSGAEGQVREQTARSPSVHPQSSTRIRSVLHKNRAKIASESGEEERALLARTQS